MSLAIVECGLTGSVISVEAVSVSDGSFSLSVCIDRILINRCWRPFRDQRLPLEHPSIKIQHTRS